MKNPQFMKIMKKNFGNKNFIVLGYVLRENCLSIEKFQFTISGGPWHGMNLKII